VVSTVDLMSSVRLSSDWHRFDVAKTKTDAPKRNTIPFEQVLLVEQVAEGQDGADQPAAAVFPKHSGEWVDLAGIFENGSTGNAVGV